MFRHTHLQSADNNTGSDVTNVNNAINNYNVGLKRLIIHYIIQNRY